MSVFSKYGATSATIAEKHWRNDGSVRGVVWCHTTGGNQSHLFRPVTHPGQYHLSRAVADYSFPVYASAMGVDLFGNDAHIAAAGAARTALLSELGVASGKVFFVGVSGGFFASMNYARANPTHVAGVIGIIPGADLNDIHANNRPVGGSENFTARINTAYGGAYIEAVHGPTHNPTNYAATMAGLPVQMWYASNDDIVLPETVTRLASLIGPSAEAINVGPLYHSDLVSAAVDPNYVARFLRTHS